MATYKATPGYSVAVGDNSVRFDWLGEYVTEDPAEIAVLDALAPTWIAKVSEEVAEEEDVKPAARTRKPAGK